MDNQDLQYVSELRTVVARLIKKLRRQTISATFLSLTERSTMAALLQNGGMLPSELAAMEKITNQSMSQIVSHLLGLGFITRTGSPTDKRKVIIALTEQGKQLIIQSRNERDSWLAGAIKETCTAEEQEILKKAIKPLTKLVDF
jgi:DNA-binding MarR family transcriptional regulator